MTSTERSIISQISTEPDEEENTITSASVPSVAAPRVLIPPLSFALVSTGVYRSGCPMPLNFPFLTKLHLKTIIYLADQDLPSDLHTFIAQNSIQVFHFRVQQVRGDDLANTANTNGIVLTNGYGFQQTARRRSSVEKEKKEKGENDPEITRQALELLLDNRNFPILIHSNKGKHRSGVLVACMRKLLQNWAFESVRTEYHYFAGEKGKADIEFIEKFEPKLHYDERWSPCWLRPSPGDDILIKISKDVRL
ncbi:hypothetical protein H072_7853 [Dactylellina haptotyla CBS 200.50]|uniref:Tyrosine specific protein phosphatases domain-containing protein n=1 Tax=Dactylellina haptotyla (strain CBS 200.50) TaxID=1284197 RepID=S8A5Y4_DACHA|nr:hypothetical protein H072_7853 [Dactylellina haptotyla CBS 200.50]